MKIVILAGILLVVVVGIAMMSGGSPSSTVLSAVCGEQGGRWQAEQSRCILGTNQSDDNVAWCREVGGDYDNCIKETCGGDGYDCLAVCRVACSF